MATVTSQLTRISDVEGTLTLTSIGGGQGGSANTEIFIQNSQSAGRKQSNATNHGFYLQVTSQNISNTGTHVGIWVTHIHYAVLTYFAIRLGSTTTDYDEHSFPVADYPATGGWVRIWVDISRTPEGTGGSFDNTALTQVGILASIPSVGGNAPNIVMDASDYTTTGLLLTGTSGTFQDFITADEDTLNNKYGVVITQGGVIFCFARLILGSSSSLSFSDTGFVLVFPDQSLAASDFMGLTIDLQNSSTSISMDNGVVRSAGTTQGDLISTGSGGTFALSNSTLANLRTISLSSGCSLDGCLISECGQITASACDLQNCTILNTTASAAVIWNHNTSINTKFSGTTFEAGTLSEHAIEFGSNIPSTITLNGLTFNSYNSDGTSGAAIFNNSGKSITLNILNGGAPTVLNGTGASTTVVAALEIELTNVVIGSTAAIIADSGGPASAGSILFLDTSVSSSTVTYAHNDQGSQPITVRVRKATTGSLYRPFELSTTINGTNLSIVINQELDE